jgi:predicted alpha/beta hydrolase family esterase
MKQQVIAIHGGTSFDTYDEYLDFIKTREINLEKLTCGEDWKGSLSLDLGEDFEVLLPRMPNGTNARYAEWCIWLERCIPFLQDNVILVGHSLGGIFLAKYLAEHSFPKKVTATVLVAAPFDDVSTEESLTDFVLPASLEKLGAQGGALYLVQSKDDPVVPLGEVEKYQRALPKAQTLLFDDRGHFSQKRFPELVSLIKSLRT